MTTTMTMTKVKGYAAHRASAALAPYQFERREPGDHDVVVDILFCGICHTDIHQVRNEWGGSQFPMVPGHEIVGWVSRVGPGVKRFRPGDSAGVGCFVDSCRVCANCTQDLQQYCEKGAMFTYNSKDKDGKPTYGGYSAQIVVDENYVLRIPPKQPLERIAPLLCAGITTYSPLRHWKVASGHRVGILGLGGLGHMAVKLAASLGADVTVFSSSQSKAADARRFGAHHVVLPSDETTIASLARRFDFILDTAPAAHDLNRYLQLLARDGVLILLGVPPHPPTVETFNLVGQRRSLAGSMIGGIAETQEMLDYCIEKKLLADVEVIPMSKINEAYERMLIGDVRYRFVLDLKTL